MGAEGGEEEVEREWQRRGSGEIMTKKGKGKIMRITGKGRGRRLVGAGGVCVTETVVKGRIMRTSEIRMRRRGRSEENTEAGGMREERNRELERMRGRRGKRKRDWGNG